MGTQEKNGSIKTDKIARALLQYRNTPLKVGNKSPAQLLFGRSLRDNIPQPLTSHMVNQHWTSYLRQREKDLHESNRKIKEYHDRNVKEHETLPVGTTVVCQNTHNKKWGRTASVVEVRNFRQYLVKMDGSGRLSIRNRLHLCPTIAKPHMLVLSGTPSITTPRESVTIPCSIDVPEQPVGTPVDTPLRKSSRIKRQPNRYGEWVAQIR